MDIHSRYSSRIYEIPGYQSNTRPGYSPSSYQDGRSGRQSNTRPGYSPNSYQDGRSGRQSNTRPEYSPSSYQDGRSGRQSNTRPGYSPSSYQDDHSGCQSNTRPGYSPSRYQDGRSGRQSNTRPGYSPSSYQDGRSGRQSNTRPGYSPSSYQDGRSGRQSRNQGTNPGYQTGYADHAMNNQSKGIMEAASRYPVINEDDITKKDLLDRVDQFEYEMKKVLLECNQFNIEVQMKGRRNTRRSQTASLPTFAGRESGKCLNVGDYFSHRDESSEGQMYGADWITRMMEGKERRNNHRSQSKSVNSAYNRMQVTYDNGSTCENYGQQSVKFPSKQRTRPTAENNFGHGMYNAVSNQMVHTDVRMKRMEKDPPYGPYAVKNFQYIDEPIKRNWFQVHEETSLPQLEESNTNSSTRPTDRKLLLVRPTRSGNDSVIGYDIACEDVPGENTPKFDESHSTNPRQNVKILNKGVNPKTCHSSKKNHLKVICSTPKSTMNGPLPSFRYHDYAETIRMEEMDSDLIDDKHDQGTTLKLDVPLKITLPSSHTLQTPEHDLTLDSDGVDNGEAESDCAERGSVISDHPDMSWVGDDIDNRQDVSDGDEVGSLLSDHSSAFHGTVKQMLVDDIYSETQELSAKQAELPVTIPQSEYKPRSTYIRELPSKVDADNVGDNEVMTPQSDIAEDNRDDPVILAPSEDEDMGKAVISVASTKSDGKPRCAFRRVFTCKAFTGNEEDRMSPQSDIVEHCEVGVALPCSDEEEMECSSSRYMPIWYPDKVDSRERGFDELGAETSSFELTDNSINPPEKMAYKAKPDGVDDESGSESCLDLSDDQQRQERMEDFVYDGSAENESEEECPRVDRVRRVDTGGLTDEDRVNLKSESDDGDVADDGGGGDEDDDGGVLDLLSDRELAGNHPGSQATNKLDTTTQATKPLKSEFIRNETKVDTPEAPTDAMEVPSDHKIESDISCMNLGDEAEICVIEAFAYDGSQSDSQDKEIEMESASRKQKSTDKERIDDVQITDMVPFASTSSENKQKVLSKKWATDSMYPELNGKQQKDPKDSDWDTDSMCRNVKTNAKKKKSRVQDTDIPCSDTKDKVECSGKENVKSDTSLHSVSDGAEMPSVDSQESSSVQGYIPPNGDPDKWETDSMDIEESSSVQGYIPPNGDPDKWETDSMDIEESSSVQGYIPPDGDPDKWETDSMDIEWNKEQQTNPTDSDWDTDNTDNTDNTDGNGEKKKQSGQDADILCSDIPEKANSVSPKRSPKHKPSSQELDMDIEELDMSENNSISLDLEFPGGAKMFDSACDADIVLPSNHPAVRDKIKRKIPCSNDHVNSPRSDLKANVESAGKEQDDPKMPCSEYDADSSRSDVNVESTDEEEACYDSNWDSESDRGDDFSWGSETENLKNEVQSEQKSYPHEAKKKKKSIISRASPDVTRSDVTVKMKKNVRFKIRRASVLDDLSASDTKSARKGSQSKRHTRIRENMTTGSARNTDIMRPADDAKKGKEPNSGTGVTISDKNVDVESKDNEKADSDSNWDSGSEFGDVPKSKSPKTSGSCKQKSPVKENIRNVVSDSWDSDSMGIEFKNKTPKHAEGSSISSPKDKFILDVKGNKTLNVEGNGEDYVALKGHNHKKSQAPQNHSDADSLDLKVKGKKKSKSKSQLCDDLDDSFMSSETEVKNMKSTKIPQAQSDVTSTDRKMKSKEKVKSKWGDDVDDILMSDTEENKKGRKLQPQLDSDSSDGKMKSEWDDDLEAILMSDNKKRNKKRYMRQTYPHIVSSDLKVKEKEKVKAKPQSDDDFDDILVSDTEEKKTGKMPRTRLDVASSEFKVKRKEEVKAKSKWNDLDDILMSDTEDQKKSKLLQGRPDFARSKVKVKEKKQVKETSKWNDLDDILMSDTEDTNKRSNMPETQTDVVSTDSKRKAKEVSGNKANSKWGDLDDILTSDAEDPTKTSPAVVKSDLKVKAKENVKAKSTWDDLDDIFMSDTEDQNKTRPAVVNSDLKVKAKEKVKAKSTWDDLDDIFMSDTEDQNKTRPAVVNSDLKVKAKEKVKAKSKWNYLDDILTSDTEDKKVGKMQHTRPGIASSDLIVKYKDNKAKAKWNNLDDILMSDTEDTNKKSRKILEIQPDVVNSDMKVKEKEIKAKKAKSKWDDLDDILMSDTEDTKRSEIPETQPNVANSNVKKNERQVKANTSKSKSNELDDILMSDTEDQKKGKLQKTRPAVVNSDLKVKAKEKVKAKSKWNDLDDILMSDTEDKETGKLQKTRSVDLSSDVKEKCKATSMWGDNLDDILMSDTDNKNKKTIKMPQTHPDIPSSELKTKVKVQVKSKWEEDLDDIFMSDNEDKKKNKMPLTYSDVVCSNLKMKDKEKFKTKSKWEDDVDHIFMSDTEDKIQQPDLKVNPKGKDKGKPYRRNTIDDLLASDMEELDTRNKLHPHAASSDLKVNPKGKDKGKPYRRTTVDDLLASDMEELNTRNKLHPDAASSDLKVNPKGKEKGKPYRRNTVDDLLAADMEELNTRNKLHPDAASSDLKVYPKGKDKGKPYRRNTVDDLLASDMEELNTRNKLHPDPASSDLKVNPKGKDKGKPYRRNTVDDLLAADMEELNTRNKLHPDAASSDLKVNPKGKDKGKPYRRNTVDDLLASDMEELNTRNKLHPDAASSDLKVNPKGKEKGKPYRRNTVDDLLAADMEELNTRNKLHPDAASSDLKVNPKGKEKGKPYRRNTVDDLLASDMEELNTRNKHHPDAASSDLKVNPKGKEKGKPYRRNTVDDLLAADMEELNTRNKLHPDAASSDLKVNPKGKEKGKPYRRNTVDDLLASDMEELNTRNKLHPYAASSDLKVNPKGKDKGKPYRRNTVDDLLAADMEELNTRNKLHPDAASSDLKVNPKGKEKGKPYRRNTVDNLLAADMEELNTRNKLHPDAASSDLKVNPKGKEKGKPYRRNTVDDLLASDMEELNTRNKLHPDAASSDLKVNPKGKEKGKPYRRNTVDDLLAADMEELNTRNKLHPDAASSDLKVNPKGKEKGKPYRRNTVDDLLASDMEELNTRNKLHPDTASSDLKVNPKGKEKGKPYRRNTVDDLLASDMEELNTRNKLHPDVASSDLKVNSKGKEKGKPYRRNTVDDLLASDMAELNTRSKLLQTRPDVAGSDLKMKKGKAKSKWDDDLDDILLSDTEETRRGTRNQGNLASRTSWNNDSKTGNAYTEQLAKDDNKGKERYSCAGLNIPRRDVLADSEAKGKARVDAKWDSGFDDFLNSTPRTQKPREELSWMLDTHVQRNRSSAQMNSTASVSGFSPDYGQDKGTESSIVLKLLSEFDCGKESGYTDHSNNANGDIMTGATCGAGDAHSSGTPDLAFGFCEDGRDQRPCNIHREVLHGKDDVAQTTNDSEAVRIYLTKESRYNKTLFTEKYLAKRQKPKAKNFFTEKYLSKRQKSNAKSSIF